MSLEALAKRAKLSSLLAQCKRRVVSEQWATWDIWSPEPLWFERHQYTSGKKLKAKPAKTKDAKLYGYDASGEVVRVQSWSGFLETWNEEELFVRTSEREMLCYRFDVYGTLMNVERYTYDDARLIAAEYLALKTKRSGSQKLVYKNGLLARVVSKNWGPSWRIEHDALGQLLRIESVWKGRRSEVYRRPARGEKLEDLLAIVRDRLVEMIPRAVAKAKPKQALFSLALVVDEEEWRHLLPPQLALGFESERKKLRAKHTGKLREELWNPNDRTMLDVVDARLEGAATRANQHIWKAGSYAKATKLVKEVVARLKDVDWSKVRAVTDDFVVFATTLEGDYWRDVKRDASPAALRQLIGRGEL